MHFDVLQKIKTMPYIKITAVVSSKCSKDSIGYQTEPVVTEEVMKEAQGMIKGHDSLSLSLDGPTVTVSGRVFPPSKTLATETSKILSEAHDSVEERNQRAEAAHKSLVDQYAQAAGLPVVE
jgi:hypothetical protein